MDATVTPVADVEETATEDGDHPVAPRTSTGVLDSLHGRLDPRAGPTRLGRYVLLREIGRGAIGVVYAAYHEGLDRKLAIKVLNKQRAGRADLEARLLREARALAKLSHPNVVQVYDVGKFEGRVFVAMEFVEGRPLSDWMRQDHEIAEIVQMFADAGRGLAAAHDAGVIHRDFKPDNVLVGNDGRPRVLDFGLARAVEHPSDNGVVAARAARRESGPLGASIDQLLHSGVLGRSVAAKLARGEVDPDETIDIDATPVPEDDLDVDQDVIVTQSNVAAAELRALPSQPKQPRAPSNEATIAPGQAEPDHPDLTETCEMGSGEFDLDPELAETVMSEPGAGTIESDEVLTRTGALMGTPAYMSPEQFLGQRVDQASDQFSFCVALYEALYGHRPFAGKNPMDLAVATQEGAIVDPPPNSPVPSWLRALLLRGLSPAPDDRFESMPVLIAALERDREQPRRRWVLGLTLAGVAAVAIAIGVFGPERDPLCPSVEDSAAPLWSDPRAAELEAAFASSDLPYADAAWATVAPQLQSWTTAWAEQRVEACAATRVRHEFSAEVLDLRQACLDRQLRSYQALYEQLGAGDAQVIEHAVEATAALPEPARCGDVDGLLSGVEGPPGAVASEVEQLRASLAELDTLGNTGRWKQALQLAREAVEQARATGYGPVVAEALLTHGRLLAQSGDGEQALVRLQDALDEGERAGHDELIPRVAVELVSLSIYTRPDPIRGRVWARRAMASLDHVREQGHLRARGIWSLGNLERIDGEFEAAEAKLREAIALLDEHAAGHPDRAVMLNDLANAIADRGDVAQARDVYDQALAASLEAFGPGHPRVGHVHFNRARLEFGDGLPEPAREQLDRARAIYVEALGPDHRDVGSVELLAAGIEISEGRIDEAEAHARRAKDIYDAQLAPDNVDRAEPHLQLGHVAFAKGEHDQAIEHYRACLAIQHAALPPGHISMAPAHTNLGLVYLVGGKPDAAAAEFERSVEILEAGAGVDSFDLNLARLYLGDALLARAEPGDPSRAVRRFEGALENCTDASYLCADLGLRAARANAAIGDADAMRRWVDYARPIYEQLGEHEIQLAELDELLAANG